MSPASRPVLQIIHFNDVYNIDVSPHEPTGGASRFISAIRTISSAHPSLVLFSGDAFSPAPLTPLTLGAEIPPILNAARVAAACLGNHELDRGLPVLIRRLRETHFPWLCSNLREKATARPLANARQFCILDRAGYRFGCIGLAGPDWPPTLDKLDHADLDYEDYVCAADRLAITLREHHRCDYIVALTHMRTPDDERLAREARDVDIILGGHDHVLLSKLVNRRYIIKSGTDFKSFSTIQLTTDGNSALCAQTPVHHAVTSDIPEDPFFAKYVADQLDLLGPAYKQTLAVSTVPLDGRFSSIRSQETGLGNFIADVLASCMNTKIALINAGSFRSDCVNPPGKITQQTINSILPFEDEAVAVHYTGRELLAILENSVSQYPLLDGRFLQVNGVSFKFDPRLPAGKRIHPGDAFCKQLDDSMKLLEEDAVYYVAVKTYIHLGKDGYPQGCMSKVISRSGTTISRMVSAYLNVDKSLEVPTISPMKEGRITCAPPDKDLVNAYRYKD